MSWRSCIFIAAPVIGKGGNRRCESPQRGGGDAPILPWISRICADKDTDIPPPGDAEPQLGAHHTCRQPHTQLHLATGFMATLSARVGAARPQADQATSFPQFAATSAFLLGACQWCPIMPHYAPDGRTLEMAKTTVDCPKCRAKFHAVGVGVFLGFRVLGASSLVFFARQPAHHEEKRVPVPNLQLHH